MDWKRILDSVKGKNVKRFTSVVSDVRNVLERTIIVLPLTAKKTVWVDLV
jgi:hypothetical protein